MDFTSGPLKDPLYNTLILNMGAVSMWCLAAPYLYVAPHFLSGTPTLAWPREGHGRTVRCPGSLSTVLFVFLGGRDLDGFLRFLFNGKYLSFSS